MKKILFFSLFIAVISGCSTTNNAQSGESVTVQGTVAKMGMTTFQYGTHLLEAGEKSYALKAENINLDNYLNKKVTIKGKKVPGYPVEGGPDFVDVTLVKIQPAN